MSLAMATAPNTPTNRYLDTPSKASVCASDFRKIEKACKPEREQSEKNRSPSLKRLLGKNRADALERVMNKAKGRFSPGKDNAWMDHCDGLWVKPASADIVKDFNDQLSALTQDLSGNIDRMLKPLIEQVGQEIKDAAIEGS